MLTAAVDRRLAASASRVVVLADHTKVGVETMSLTVPTGQIECVITDEQADPDEVEPKLREAGVQVIVAPLVQAGLNGGSAD